MSSVRRLLSALIVVPVMVMGFMPMASEPAEAAGPDDPAPVVDGPALDPDESFVDDTRLVLIPAEGVSQAEIAAKVAEVTGATDLGEADLDAGGELDTAMALTTTDPETSELLAQELAASGLVEAVEYGWQPVTMYHSSPNDPAYLAGDQWALGPFPGGNFSSVWSRLSNAKLPGSAPIADIDTGFQMNHPDAHCGNIKAGHNYGDGGTNVNPTNMGSDGVTYHGTATAGVMAACTDNAIDVAGAGWDQVVWVYKVSNAATGQMTDAALVNAIYGATNDGARVINLSLGFIGSTMPSDLKAAVDYAIAAKVVVVASAGNYGDQSIGGVYNPVVWPAAYTPVISVAALTSTGQVASFSTRNSGVDIAAPGQGIAVLTKDAWTYEAGTSFSSPLVATAAAMLLRFQPNLTPAQVTKALKATARNIGAPASAAGAGALDVLAALDYQHELPAYKPIMKQILLSPSLAGSRFGDVITIRASDGALLRYPSSSNGKLGAAMRIGTGFQNMTMYAPGDWNRDGHNDLIGIDSSGNMFLYAGTGRGYIQAGKKIGHGWSNFTVIPAGDLNRDGNPDLVAINKKTGFLFLYAGNGKGGFKSPYPKIGHGWKSMQVFAAGDLNRDGKNDLLAVSSKGQLLFYPGRGDGTVRAGGQIGHGWTNNYLAAGADLNGDRIADIVGRNNKTGQLNFYRGKGGGTFNKPVQIGSGF